MKRLFLLSLFVSTAALAESPQTKVTPLEAKEFQAIPGKEGLLVKVQYPPGGADPAHRHNAYVFVCVLEGAVVMQVKGGKEVTLKAGQTFTEDPQDIHTVGRNASKTRPASFLAFLVKDKGAPPVLPAE